MRFIPNYDLGMCDFSFTSIYLYNKPPQKKIGIPKSKFVQYDLCKICNRFRKIFPKSTVKDELIIKSKKLVMESWDNRHGD